MKMYLVEWGPYSPILETLILLIQGFISGTRQIIGTARNVIISFLVTPNSTYWTMLTIRFGPTLTDK